MRAHDDMMPQVRELEAAALEAHRRYARTHSRLREFVRQENGRRLHKLAVELEESGLGWCRGCSRVKRRDDLDLYLWCTDKGLKGSDGYVSALCTHCSRPEGNWRFPRLKSVRVVGVFLEYQRGRQWLPVPRGEWNHPERWAPTRVSAHLATRFDVLPSLRLDHRSKPAPAPPQVEVL